MEQFCKHYLKPISACATFSMMAITICFIWLYDFRAISQILKSGLYIKLLFTYFIWMFGNFIVYKIYVPFPYLRNYLNTAEVASHVADKNKDKK